MGMIVMDMDGTLLNSHQEISSYTKDILITLQEKGESIVLASGRDIHGLVKYGNVLHLLDYPQSGYICLNGLEIYDSLGNLLHKEQGLTYQDSLCLEKLAIEYSLDMIFFFKDALFIIEYGHTGIVDHHFGSSTKYKIKSVQEIKKSYFEDLRKVALIQHSKTIGCIIQSLQKRTTNQFDLCRVEDNWIEVNPYGLNKGSALKEYAKIKDIPLHDVLAFGNGENDIEMLKMAGCGIAMENSFFNVKEMADEICGSCEEDGIGIYLARRYKL